MINGNWSGHDLFLRSNMATPRDIMFGVAEPLFINELVFIATNLLCKRFLYNINSGEVDYDLVKKYKISLYEKIYFEHILAKEYGSVTKFLKYLYNGNGFCY